MGKKLYGKDVLRQAKQVLSAWVQIDEQLVLGPFTTGTLVTSLNRAESLENAIRDFENRLSDLRNQRDANRRELWDIVKRARLGVRFLFGDDSSQYELVGGTRLSDRKSPRRTATPEL